MSVRATGERMAAFIKIEQLEAEVERLRAKEGQRPRWREGMSDIVAQLGARAAVWDNLNGMLDREAIDEIKRLRAENDYFNAENERMWNENERLRALLADLVEAVTAEVNEKGGGGYILARLSDAHRALGEKG